MVTPPRLALALAVALPLADAACKSDPPPPPPQQHGFQQAPAASAAPRVCTFGADQTCNDDPLISSIHGACNQDGTCACQPGFQVNAATGRCK